ncbi:MAG: 3-oxoacyl-ACP reductase family protein [Acidobacteriota bacterium]|nr:3-oxoacyl-ACP reductase family protein [Acidobacteriota bacterium]
MSLQGKLAFVTGGSRGIGRAICMELAAAGARIAFLYRSDDDAAAQTQARLKAAGAEVRAYKGDVRDRALLARLFKILSMDWGKLDILVNNAGINKPTDFDKLEDADWDEIMGVNLKGPYVCSQTALPVMNDGGSIIMIGSISGQYGGPRTAHYAASKAGLISLGQVIARFAAPRRIRCNTIAAGLIQSEMAAAGLASEAVRKAAENIPLKTLGTPADVARAVRFLASDESAYITAQTINVNGGLYF